MGKTIPEIAREVVLDDRRRYANLVLARMRGKPRFGSIGRKSYVYVEDVAQVLDEELGNQVLGSGR